MIRLIPIRLERRCLKTWMRRNYIDLRIMWIIRSCLMGVKKLRRLESAGSEDLVSIINDYVRDMFDDNIDRITKLVFQTFIDKELRIQTQDRVSRSTPIIQEDIIELS